MHRPVLLSETMELLDVREGATYVDCTVGSGGHAEAVLERAGTRGRLLGLDRDSEALARAAERLGRWRSRCVLEHADLGDLARVAREKELADVDGVVMDLGLSSEQLADPSRGFSFQTDGPLDMRFDRTGGETAQAFLQRVTERELVELLRAQGETRWARRIAKAIIRAREEKPIATTAELARIVERAKEGRRGARLHPATKTFMAVRMAVNRELESIERGVRAALELVKIGGRVAVITFHSTEDRLVKRLLASHVGSWESLASGGRRWRGEEPAVTWINRKPVTPQAEEIEQNPRARSAKLRVVERIR